MATFTLSPPAYGKVVGRFIVAIGDGIDSDTFPDGVVPTGTITFTPSVTKVLIANGSPDPVTLELQPITATIDSSGYLTFNGQQGVWLVATNDTNTNPNGFTYKVSYNISYTGGVIDTSKFDIQVPAATQANPSSWTDLSKAAPVPSSAGNAMVVGPGGPAGATPTFTVRNVTTGDTPAVVLDGTNAPAYKMDFTLPSGGGAGTVKSVNAATPDPNGNVALTAAAIGLGSVDNTADVNKPVSTLQATALAGKLPMIPGAAGRFCGVITDQSQLPSSGMQYGDMYVLLSAS